MTSLGYNAYGGVFGGCEQLSAIYVAAENQNYTSIDGVLFSKDCKTLVAYPAGASNVYHIPENVAVIDSGGVNRN